MPSGTLWNMSSPVAPCGRIHNKEELLSTSRTTHHSCLLVACLAVVLLVARASLMLLVTRLLAGRYLSPTIGRGRWCGFLARWSGGKETTKLRQRLQKKIIFVLRFCSFNGIFKYFDDISPSLMSNLSMVNLLKIMEIFYTNFLFSLTDS